MPRTRNQGPTPITEADLERFHRSAPAALARRGGSFVFEEIGRGARSIVMGLVPIVGLACFDWSANQMLLFLIVGTWTAIACDAIKLRMLPGAIDRFARMRYDDWQVWVVAQALRERRDTAPAAHLRAKYEPWKGVFVDVVMGGISTVFTCILLASADADWGLALLGPAGTGLALATFVLYQIAFTAWEIVDHRGDAEQDRGAKVAVGLRGVGLFLLMFVVVGVTESESLGPHAIRTVMLLIDGSIVAAGIFTAVGPLMLRRETAWLRAYLERRDADQGETSRRKVPIASK